VSTTFAAGIGQLGGGLRETQAWIALAIGAVAAWAAYGRASATRQKITLADGILFAVFAIASMRAFLWVIYEQGNELKVLSPHNLGDMSLHLNLIRRWAAGGDFWPENPFMSGAIFPYHPGMDLWNALLAIAGVPVFEGLRWTGLLGAAATAAALWRWGRGFAMAAFLFAGGLSAFAYVAGAPYSATEEGVAWKNLFLSMFVTQRGLLYALPCGLLLLRAWRDDFFREGSGLPRSVQFFLYTTMPFFSVHAFLFLSFALAAIFIFTPKSRVTLLLFVASAVIPATVAIWLVTGGFSASSGLRWLPGWMQGDGGWKFWAINFGISLPLLTWLYCKAAVRGNAESRAFCVLSLGVFLLCFLVALAPWEWDNTKLLLWAWLVAAPFLWSDVLEPLGPILRAALCVALFFTGAVSLMAGLDGRHGYELAKKSELAATRMALRDVPPGARIAVDPTFNHPVMLLGYPVVCGYDGHLWSHGLRYQEPLSKLRSVLRQETDWKETAKELGAEWVYFRGPIPVLQRVNDSK